MGSPPPRPTQSRPPRPIHREVSRGGTPRRVPPEENFEQATAPPTGGRDGAAASGTPTRKAKTTRRAKATPDPETARREAEERAAAHAAKVAEDEARTRQEVIARLEADLGQRLDDLTDVELPADAGELRDLLKRHRVPFPTALRRTGKTTAAAIVADRDVLRLLVATLGAAA